MTNQQRLKLILTYALSDQKIYAACDIPTRKQIDDLVVKIDRLYTHPTGTLTGE